MRRQNYIIEVTHSLLGGVGVIETDNQFSLIHPGKVLVEDGCFSMTDVKITTRLRRESSDNLPFDGIWQT
jgi:hypothetical protein